ncbi:MAG: DnaJ domain-containing protein [Candidatus Micrarchaeia archaeon]
MTGKQKRNPYTVLGVRQDANKEEIKKAFKRLAKRYHPDKNPGHASAEVRMGELYEARDELLKKSDKKKPKNKDKPKKEYTHDNIVDMNLRTLKEVIFDNTTDETKTLAADELIKRIKEYEGEFPKNILSSIINGLNLWLITSEKGKELYTAAIERREMENERKKQEILNKLKGL